MVVPWMMSVPLLQGVVLEGVEHQQTTDVVCLLMIMDSWQLAVFLWNKKKTHKFKTQKVHDFLGS